MNKAQPKLSKAGKMPCRSWSLEAVTSCPGARDGKGGLVPACKGCYATDGNYRFPNVKAPRLHNQQDWKSEDWVQAMIKQLDNDRYFRWFDSGDMYSFALAEKILEVMKQTPWVRHWLPTRMHKFSKFQAIIDQMNALPNVVVRLSSDSINGEVIQGQYTSTIVPFIEDTTTGMTACTAYERQGKCADCRECWSKDVQVIAYPAHGRKMLGLIARSAA